MTRDINCFKAYDIRGRVPEELNVDIAYRIGRAFAEFLSPKNVVVGYDIRLTSPELNDALTRGLQDSGVDVINIGLCGTEEIYFATSHLNVDGGIIVTASHNPKNYNGMKFVRKNSVPISGDTGLEEIRSIAESNSSLLISTIDSEISESSIVSVLIFLISFSFSIICTFKLSIFSTWEKNSEFPVKFDILASLE